MNASSESGLWAMEISVTDVASFSAWEVLTATNPFNNSTNFLVYLGCASLFHASTLLQDSKSKPAVGLMVIIHARGRFMPHFRALDPDVTRHRQRHRKQRCERCQQTDDEPAHKRRATHERSTQEYQRAATSGLLEPRLQPGEITAAARVNIDHQELRRFIAVQFVQPRLKCRDLAGAGLEQQQRFHG